MFDAHAFIVESNKIDPQYNECNMLIPGDVPGTPMYDNQFRALEVISILRENNATPLELPCILHRELTRGISIFETKGMSGIYRNCKVTIGGQYAPDFWLAIKTVREILIPKIDIARTIQHNESEAKRFAWWCHDLFECLHPFIDGNGRTGRLLLNTVLEFLGHEKIVVYEKDKEKYYEHIQWFRDNKFRRIIENKGRD